MKSSTRIDEKPQETPFQCDEIIIELDHERRISISRGLIRGNDGIEISCGLGRSAATANAGFVVRPLNFSVIGITVEQVK